MGDEAGAVLERLTERLRERFEDRILEKMVVSEDVAAVRAY